MHRPCVSLFACSGVILKHATQYCKSDAYVFLLFIHKAWKFIWQWYKPDDHFFSLSIEKKKANFRYQSPRKLLDISLYRLTCIWKRALLYLFIHFSHVAEIVGGFCGRKNEECGTRKDMTIALKLTGFHKPGQMLLLYFSNNIQNRNCIKLATRQELYKT